MTKMDRILFTVLDINYALVLVLTIIVIYQSC